MAAREPLTEKERRQVQWAYHKGADARKQIIQNLFGRHITHASCMAMVDKYVRQDEMDDKVKAVAKPTEEELWDWLCCAAYHGNIWSSDANGKIRNWVEIHCQVMGESIWEEHESPELFAKHIVPPPIPKNRKIVIWSFLRKVWRQVPRAAVSVLSFAAGILFDKAVNQLFP